MELLERGAELESLSQALDSARAGRGCIALVSGEAGIGKTTLVEAFTHASPPGHLVLRGVCDALFTPRPLGPLYDIALQLPGRLMEQLNQQAERLAIFTTFLQILRNNQSPTIAVLEDIHWADEATLDLVKFLGRRIQQTRCLLILTYRDDEVGSQHPLWFVLGEIPSQAVRRLRLARLSEAATGALARQAGRDPHQIYRITGGNPFFVSEVLADQTVTIPRSVQAAVLARAARLSPAQRELLDLASVFPTQAERALLDAILAPSVEILEVCATTGLVRLEPDALRFRHELARRAILDAMPPPRARQWHTAVLEELLREDEPPLSRVVHHARLAGNSAIVWEYAPQAAEQAASLSAHREAVAHYESALQHAGALSTRERAEILEKRAYEYYLTGRIEEAVADRTETLRLWSEEQEAEKEGATLRWLSRLSWFQGQREAAEAYAVQAIEKLASLPHGEELAMAYSNRAQLHMLADEAAQAVEWGNQAIQLARELGIDSILAHALNNVGTAMLLAGDQQGRVLLVQSLNLALTHELQEHVARAYTNLGSEVVRQHDYGRAMVYLNQGIAYSEDRDLDSWSFYMRGWRARAHLEQGRWEEAEADAAAVLSVPQRAAALRLPALAALGTLYVRRGNPVAYAILDEARDLAHGTGELQRLVPVAAARAEAAWWQGGTDTVIEETRHLFDRVHALRDEWATGELGFWLWRAGALPAGMEHATAEPYALQMRGDWRGAASAWERLGCPYPQALALSDGDANAQRSALAILVALDAVPAADALRRAMHAAGIRGIPRGPRGETRQNPAGLTDRQWEVLALLVEGLSDRAIAERLHITVKTAGHHISAILGRLEVGTRDEAARFALRYGWFAYPDMPETPGAE
jgi:predicted ATPase/DNA-binding CsgD family transcriptional regulator